MSSNHGKSNEVRFGVRAIGSLGWHSVWRGVILTPGGAEGPIQELVGDEHPNPCDALGQAREIHAARQAPVAMAA